jgi:nicotinamide-nucleotide amidase
VSALDPRRAAAPNPPHGGGLSTAMPAEVPELPSPASEHVEGNPPRVSAGVGVATRAAASSLLSAVRLVASAEPTMENDELADEIGARLAGATVAVAESVTAGRIAQCFAGVDGASEFFRGGLVAYEEAVKRTLLHVSAPRVVSRAAALEMARGAAELFDADVTIATTGVAGAEPQDGMESGTVFVATLVAQVTNVREHHFDGSPVEVCDQACHAALGDLHARLVALGRA